MPFVHSVIGGVFILLFAARIVTLSDTVLASSNEMFADVHVHYNWDQAEVTSPQSAATQLQRSNTAIAVVSSTPSAYALKLRDAGGKFIIPFFSPYITPQHKNNWYLDHEVINAAREGLQSGEYKGIGELHLWAGFPPRLNNKVLNGLLDLAEYYDVPFLVHTEASNSQFFAPLCKSRPKTRFLWAHAGGILPANDVVQLMEQCVNVWVELSARDPWRYNSLVTADQQLPEQWINAIVRFPTRFMAGTDPVWSVRKSQRWDEPDEGWTHYTKLQQFNRHWINQLPTAVQTNVRINNARRFLRIQ